MKTNKLTIAETLKDKPKGTKLYSPLCGDCWLVTADYKGDEFGENFPIVVSQEKDDKVKALKTISFTAHGTLFENVGECMLFPSKDMRDWEKFAWKIGDVLATIDGVVAMFDGWAEDDYTRFNTTYSLEYEDDTTIYFCEDDIYLTEAFHNDTEPGKKDFIKKIENKYGGKFNPETLKVEKQYEFKDGDIVYFDLKVNGETVAILKEFAKDGSPVVYASYFIESENTFACPLSILCRKNIIIEKRLATEKEKELILSKLASIGKKWNPDTKQIEDLSKPQQFKPFDKVLVKDFENKEWHANIFSHIENDSEYQFTCIQGSWRYCIPYEGNEHLLGTTDSPSK